VLNADLKSAFNMDFPKFLCACLPSISSSNVSNFVWFYLPNSENSVWKYSIPNKKQATLCPIALKYGTLWDTRCRFVKSKTAYSPQIVLIKKRIITDLFVSKRSNIIIGNRNIMIGNLKPAFDRTKLCCVAT